jgi:hypothetical protein
MVEAATGAASRTRAWRQLCVAGSIRHLFDPLGEHMGMSPACKCWRSAYALPFCADRCELQVVQSFDLTLRLNSRTMPAPRRVAMSRGAWSNGEVGRLGGMHWTP